MSERTVSQTEHLYVTRAHAKAERARRILDDEMAAQKLTIGNLRTSAISLAENLAEKEWCLRKAEEDVGSLQVELAAAHDVAKELNASNERLLERAETAERRLRQVQSGETDEELAMLRSQLDAASRKLEDQEELLSHAATQADELRTRAQKAEAELATVKPKLQRALAELATERKRAESLEAEVETSEAEFTALKEGPCDASA